MNIPLKISPMKWMALRPFFEAKFRGIILLETTQLFCSMYYWKGLKAHFQRPFCREPTCTLPYCKSNMVDDFSIESLSYRNLDMQFQNLAGLGPRIM